MYFTIKMKGFRDRGRKFGGMSSGLDATSGGLEKIELVDRCKVVPA